MLADELREALKQIEDDISIITRYFATKEIEERYNRLSQETMQEDFWKRSDQAARLQELQRLTETRTAYYAIMNAHKELPELIDLLGEDETELHRLSEEVRNHCQRVRSFKIQILLSEESDDKDCFLSINAGAGGTESQDWSNMLLRMYLYYFEQRGWDHQEINKTEGDEAGLKDVTLHIKAPMAFGLLSAERGTHRLARVSPFNAQGLIPESERPERFVFWPMGIPSPGAMRIHGTHAIAFIGQRHFDAPRILDELGLVSESPQSAQLP